ncbi:MAG: hypothetical protein LBH96_04235, partial [Candidatus Peribacteria bacterium]|nr:hypothetical protein [Candidatus Peribacteria bacterium]
RAAKINAIRLEPMNAIPPKIRIAHGASSSIEMTIPTHIPSSVQKVTKLMRSPQKCFFAH